MMKKYLIILSLILFAFFSCENSKNNKTTYYPHKLESVPYSESVLVGDILYISGQIGNVENDYNKK